MMPMKAKSMKSIYKKGEDAARGEVTQFHQLVILPVKAKSAGALADIFRSSAVSSNSFQTERA